MKRLNISHSSSESLAGCARRFEFNKILQFSSHDGSKSSAGGTAMHEAWYEYLRTGSKRDAVWQMLTRYPAEEIGKAYDSWSIEAVYETLTELLDYPLLSQYTVAKIDGKPAIEIPFEIRLKDIYLDREQTIPIYYVGFIDVILYDDNSNEYIAVDLKNTARWSNNYEAFYRFSSQMLPYGLVLQTILGSDHTLFRVLYLQTYVNLKEPRIDEFPFTIDSDQRLPDLVMNLAATITQLQMFYRFKRWPRRGSSCFSFNKVCPYYDYCEEPNDLIEAAFSKRTEDHFKKYEERALKITLDMQS